MYLKKIALALMVLCFAGAEPCFAAEPTVNSPATAPTDQQNLNRILDSTVTSNGSQANQTLPPGLGNTQIPLWPQELRDHNKNKVINLGPLHTGPLIKIASLTPIRMDADYTQPISLKDALSYALSNSLAIRINMEGYHAQRYQFFGSIGQFLPSFGINANPYTHSVVLPRTKVNSRVYQENMSFPVFRGGSVFYGMLIQLYRMRGAHAQYFTSVNDTLLNTYNAYYNLLLQRTLLQIRIKSVEVSEAQLKLNTQLYTAGTGTAFAVMQSRTQLALDRQALLQQQIAVRLASIELGYTINAPLGVNLVPMETSCTESELVDQRVTMNDLLDTTYKHRPEITQYNMLRLQAARAVQTAASPLYPTASWGITAQHSSTSVHGGGAGGASLGALNSAASNSSGAGGGSLSGAPAVGVTTAGIPQINGSPLQIPQIAAGTGNLTVTPGQTNVTYGTSTAATTTGGGGSTVVTGGAGNLVGGGGLSSGNAAVTGISGIGSFGGKFNAAAMGFNTNWQLSNLGTNSAFNILSAMVGERQAVLQANQALLGIENQVRPSYLNMLSAREQIDVTAVGVASGNEELRLANLRVQMGVGTNLELIQAQRDYIQALINQAQAIIASNQAQAQLLHDTGVISLDALTTGYRYR